MKIKSFPNYTNQMCSLGSNVWSVPRLCELSKRFEVFEIPVNHLNLYHVYKTLTIRDMVSHMQAVLNADLKC